MSFARIAITAPDFQTKAQLWLSSFRVCVSRHWPVLWFEPRRVADDGGVFYDWVYQVSRKHTRTLCVSLLADGTIGAFLTDRETQRVDVKTTTQQIRAWARLIDVRMPP